MDEGGGGSSQQGGTMGMSWGGLDGGTAPMPPIFGNASASTSGDMDVKGITLDDVFAGVFFSPKGDLLDIGSADEEGYSDTNITLSSPTGPQFAQYAVLGGSSGGHVLDSTTAAPVKAEGQQQPLDGVGLDPSPLPAPTEAAGPGAEARGASAAGTRDLTSMPQVTGPAPAASAGAGIVQQDTAAWGTSAGPAERAAAAAAAEAAEARAAQETAVSKAAAAAKAAAAHAQAQAHIQQGVTYSGNISNSAGPGLPSLPTGGMPGDTPTQIGGAGWGIGLGRGVMPGARGFRPVVGGFGVRAMGGGAAPRRQRHKVSSRDLTEEQRIERRERNREHAKRSRIRKKFLLDSLQRSVDALQAENDSLKGSIVESLGDRGRMLVAKCAPEDVGGIITANPIQATKILDDPDYALVKALQTAQQNFVITDASLPDNPIVFASSGFLELTGYKLTEVLGRNCRFLQGPATDPRAVDKIRKAIEEGADASVCLLNYRADTTTFWNQFFVAALRDAEGSTVNYVGVQCKVGDDYARIVVNEQNRQFTAPGPARQGVAASAPARVSTTLPSPPETASGSGGEAAAGGGVPVNT